MSDEECYFNSMADAGASKTYPQQIGIIRKNGYIMIKARACKVGAVIFKKALSYPLKLIAKNAGDNGSVVIEKVLLSDNFKHGYNAATEKYEDLMATRIIDPTKLTCITFLRKV